MNHFAILIGINNWIKGFVDSYHQVEDDDATNAAGRLGAYAKGSPANQIIRTSRNMF